MRTQREDPADHANDFGFLKKQCETTIGLEVGSEIVFGFQESSPTSMKTLTAGVRAAVVGSSQVMSGVQETLMDTSLSQGGGSGDDDTLRGEWQNEHLLSQERILPAMCLTGTGGTKRQRDE